MLRIVASDEAALDGPRLGLDTLVRKGARRMLLTALKAEVEEYMSQHAGMRDETGHALVVRNGVSEPRTVTTTAGQLEVQAPRVNDRREGRHFTSAILPLWARRSPKVADVLPVLYLRGIPTKDFEASDRACSVLPGFQRLGQATRPIRRANPRAALRPRCGRELCNKAEERSGTNGRETTRKKLPNVRLAAEAIRKATAVPRAPITGPA